MTAFGERIKKARIAAGLSQQALADAICQLGNKKTLSRAAIAQWESGVAKGIEASNLLRASQVLGVNPEWLQFGIGNTQAIPPPFVESVPAFNITSVPLLSYTQAANFREEIQKVKETSSTTEISPIGLDNKLAKIAGPLTFALTVRNNSMAPWLKPSDIVIIDPRIKPQSGEIVVAKLINENSVIIRKYRPLGKDKNGIELIELAPRNRDWPKVIIPFENSNCIIGTLIEHRCRRQLKR